MNHLSFTQLSADDNISQLDVSFARWHPGYTPPYHYHSVGVWIEDDGVPRDFILMIEMDRSEPLLSAALLWMDSPSLSLPSNRGHLLIGLHLLLFNYKIITLHIPAPQTISLTVGTVRVGDIGQAGHLSHALISIVVVNQLLLDDRQLEVDVLKIETHTSLG